MTKEQFIARATSTEGLLGLHWKLDRWGHLQSPTGDYRLKLSRIAVRFERRHDTVGWFRLRSGYFSKLSMSPEGKLLGLEK